MIAKRLASHSAPAFTYHKTNTSFGHIRNSFAISMNLPRMHHLLLITDSLKASPCQAVSSRGVEPCTRRHRSGDCRGPTNRLAAGSVDPTRTRSPTVPGPKSRLDRAGPGTRRTDRGSRPPAAAPGRRTPRPAAVRDESSAARPNGLPALHREGTRRRASHPPTPPAALPAPCRRWLRAVKHCGCRPGPARPPVQPLGSWSARHASSAGRFTRPAV